VPELPEVEGYRDLAERLALGRTVVSVDTPDSWYLKRGTVPDALTEALVGQRFSAARRRGKLLLLDVDSAPPVAAGTPVAPGPPVAPGSPAVPASPAAPAGPTLAGPTLAGPTLAGTVLGLRFGMSGRLIVDGRASVDRLLYTTAVDRDAYERFAVNFADGGRLAMRDPRRLGGVELDPDEDRLGPDALTATVRDLRRALAGGPVALKARLLDQSRLAGVGNLVADEVLWRAGLAPIRPADSLTDAELRRLYRHLSGGLAELIKRGGSHTGDLQTERFPGGRCPRDHEPLVRATVGGRTTWWCPRHQK
jgi:formamidopyrimidine-DNA glycosylase